MVNFPQFFNQMQMLIQNPAQFIAARNLPQEMLTNPQAVVQNLMNSGRMTQEQFNQLRQTAQQLQNLPQFRQLFK